jgi:hypothetical protein
MCSFNFLNFFLFFFFCKIFAVNPPYSLNITINCNNKNTNESSLQSHELVDEKGKGKGDVSDPGGFWLTLYSYKRGIFLISVALYFGQFMNFQFLQNGLLYVKNKIVHFLTPSKNVFDYKKKPSLCLLCQKSIAFSLLI